MHAAMRQNGQNCGHAAGAVRLGIADLDGRDEAFLPGCGGVVRWRELPIRFLASAPWISGMSIELMRQRLTADRARIIEPCLPSPADKPLLGENWPCLRRLDKVPAWPQPIRIWLVRPRL
jgi:hypothetical protein